MSRDLIEVLSALVLLAVCGGIAIASAVPRRAPAPRQRERKRTAAEPSPAAPTQSLGPRTDGRPRIFTGEPGPSDPEPPPARRAFRLVAGMTVLAAAGALGLLAIVRAMVAMFR
jgi:hypothetical protein